jgi:DNA-binding transcriptional ArsR family regulator
MLSKHLLHKEGQAAVPDSTASQTALPSADRGSATPGTPTSPLKITDPRAMRALAHPARLAIIEHLGLEGPATATECAEVAGLSPSACSYHLRALARYGFVEEDREHAVDGRHRPWRVRAISFDIASVSDQPRAARPAARLLLQAARSRSDQIRADYEEREAAFPREWREAGGWMQDVLHVTPAELDQLRSQVAELTGRHRRLDPADRPADARRVFVVLDLVPWFDPNDAKDSR